jgi:lipopolysaccharide biosynthesis glycosyltransferase
MNIEEIKNNVIKQDFFGNLSDAKNQFHIGLGINADFVRPMGVLITSISTNNPDILISFHVFKSFIIQDDILKLKLLTDKFKNISIQIYHVNEEVIIYLPTNKIFPLATYFRMLMPIVLDDLNSLLYLDSDIVCLNNISELTKIDLTDYICAVIQDIDSDKSLKRLELNKKQYFNSGVMLINIKRWNEQNISEKSFELLPTRPFLCFDQDVLNIILENKACYLPIKWNCATKWETKDIVFLHYMAHPKPWYAIYKEEAQKHYLQYEKLSPWVDQPLILPTFFREARLYAKLLQKRGEYGKSLFWYAKYIVMKAQYSCINGTTN